MNPLLELNSLEHTTANWEVDAPTCGFEMPLCAKMRAEADQTLNAVVIICKDRS